QRQGPVIKAAAIAEAVILRIEADKRDKYDLGREFGAVRGDRYPPYSVHHHAIRRPFTKEKRLILSRHHRESHAGAARNGATHPGLQVKLVAERRITGNDAAGRKVDQLIEPLLNRFRRGASRGRGKIEARFSQLL